jgi:hypothetical protein
MTASTEPFYALAAALKASGFAAHGARLEEALNGTWTTSSELMGELGAVLVSIRRDCQPLDVASKRLLQKCQRHVIMVWPGFGWFRWIPFIRYFR